jgi:hypothetical protein
LNDSQAALQKVAEDYPEADLIDTYRDVDLYLTVARSLLTGSVAEGTVGPGLDTLDVRKP